MPVHDWTCVEAGIFHDFHNSWATHIKESLNEGLLPPDFYALVEQHTNEIVPDILSLHAANGEGEQETGKGGIALLETPPKVSRKYVSELRPLKTHTQKHVAVRHISHHRVVALIEIVSPANKDRPASVKTFALKARSMLDLDIHLLIVDLFPPGKHDPRGVHGALWKAVKREKEKIPEDQPICLVSYLARKPPEAYLEWVAIGTVLPVMPLFLDASRYVNVPLEETYQTAYAGVPRFWRTFIEQHQPQPPSS